MKHVPKQLSQWLLQILPTVWNTLTQSAHVYVATVVNETEELEEQVDLDGQPRSLFFLSPDFFFDFHEPDLLAGEVISFENLVSAIFEFVHALVETPRFRSSVREGISQVPSNQSKHWHRPQKRKKKRVLERRASLIQDDCNKNCFFFGQRQQVIYYIILFMQITEDQAATWTCDADRFVEDESDDSFAYSVRLSAQDLLLVSNTLAK